ncbi:MAG TPA: alpha/beta hydrolase [Candidatus Binatia bacterium]|nr:alpha/beta hydrolase [Candidatus Binatia bacterium]
MLWQLAASYPDYLYQLSALLRDPVYHGSGVPHGRGQPVLLIPGFLAGDWTLGVMAGWLNRMGYHAYFSGINWNVDCPNKTAEVLRWRLDYIIEESGGPLVVIGHSLGGMLARFLGVNFPEKIGHIFALGAPIDGNSLKVHPLVPLAFCTLQALRKRTDGLSPACGSPVCSCRFSRTAFSALPAGVGFTSIFTKRDEVVDWRSCVDPQGENRQVSGRHIGLIVNRQVYRILASTLAAHHSGTEQTGLPASP